MKTPDIESISEQIHKNYCEYVLARTGKPYWTSGDYSKLDEATKEADRIQARWFAKAIQEEREGFAKWHDEFYAQHKRYPQCVEVHAEFKVEVK